MTHYSGRTAPKAVRPKTARSCYRISAWRAFWVLAIMVRDASQKISGYSVESAVRYAAWRHGKSAGISQNKGQSAMFGGGGGIRTHEALARLPVFKTGALNRSATPPRARQRTAGAGIPIRHGGTSQ